MFRLEWTHAVLLHCTVCNAACLYSGLMEQGAVNTERFAMGCCCVIKVSFVTHQDTLNRSSVCCCVQQARMNTAR